MRNLTWLLMLGWFFAVAAVAAPPPQDSTRDLSWAFPVPPEGVTREDDPGPRHVPGSTRTYTQKQIDDAGNAPDWFPDEHAPMPRVVQHGSGPVVPACAMCHLASGSGHPESADLTGLPVSYVMRQVAEFKSGARKDYSRMAAIAQGLSEEDARLAAEWFATLKPVPWTRVVEADTVPKSILRGRMRFPAPGGGTEPIGNRIIILPEDPERTHSRDPHSGFIAYVPPGSIARGEALVTTGAGKTIACGACHGGALRGLGEVPRISGVSPIYIFRQLHDIKHGTRSGVWTELMKPVVASLSEDDMLAIAAYLTSRGP